MCESGEAGEAGESVWESLKQAEERTGSRATA